VTSQKGGGVRRKLRVVLSLWRLGVWGGLCGPARSNFESTLRIVWVFEFLDRAAFPHPSQDLISRGTARGPASKTVGNQVWNFVDVVTLVVRPIRISHFLISVFFVSSIAPNRSPHEKPHMLSDGASFSLKQIHRFLRRRHIYIYLFIY
jgi:hypothetical protein